MMSYLLYKKKDLQNKGNNNDKKYGNNPPIPLWMILMLLSLNKHDECVSLVIKKTTRDLCLVPAGWLCTIDNTCLSAFKKATVLHQCC